MESQNGKKKAVELALVPNRWWKPQVVTPECFYAGKGSTLKQSIIEKMAVGSGEG